MDCLQSHRRVSLRSESLKAGLTVKGRSVSEVGEEPGKGQGRVLKSG